LAQIVQLRISASSAGKFVTTGLREVCGDPHVMATTIHAFGGPPSGASQNGGGREAAASA